MKKQIFKGFITFSLVISLILSLFGCSTKVNATDLMKGITPNSVSQSDDLTVGNVQITDFAVRLLKASRQEGNTLISPISVMAAISMTANGAKNNTLEQMEAVLGMPVEDLNNYFYSYMKSLPQGEKYKLMLANSIWFREAEYFNPNKDFLQINADYYGADIYAAPFDKTTVKDINNWAKDKTDNMIPKILDDIPAEAVMYLANALAFEAEWQDIYNKNQVNEGEFTLADGTTQTVEFMYSEESRYFEDEKATGFIKYYADKKYAFVALLPNEGVSIDDYVNTLNGESLNRILSNPENRGVKAAIPKFESESDLEMSEMLKSMGMTEAFDADKADFSGLGSSSLGNIYMNRVLHKTMISVGEKGTKAGAVTVIEMVNETAIGYEKTVYLNRPFVYMLIDCETNIPFFMGTMTNVNQ